MHCGGAGVSMILEHLYGALTHSVDTQAPFTPADWFPNPDAFDPERFMDIGGEFLESTAKGGGEEDGGAAATRRKKKFMPFSEGPRSCVGMTLAIAEAKTALIAIASRFRIELDPRMGGVEGTHSRQTCSLTLKVEGGMWLKLTPRLGARVAA